MKKLCTLALFLFALLTALPSLAADTDAPTGFWAEAQMSSDGGKRLVGYYEKFLGDSNLGYYAVVALEPGYHMAYVGPTWKPFGWLQVGAALGYEGKPNGIRRNAFFQADVDKISVYGSFENGASGVWHKVTATYKLSEMWGGGVMTETGFGTGPRVEYNMIKNTQIWGAVLHDRNTGKYNTVVAVNYTF